MPVLFSRTRMRMTCAPMGLGWAGRSNTMNYTSCYALSLRAGVRLQTSLRKK
jgi:hypothetical protein